MKQSNRSVSSKKVDHNINKFNVCTKYQFVLKHKEWYYSSGNTVKKGAGLYEHALYQRTPKTWSRWWNWSSGAHYKLPGLGVTTKAATMARFPMKIRYQILIYWMCTWAIKKFRVVGPWNRGAIITNVWNLSTVVFLGYCSNVWFVILIPPHLPVLTSIAVVRYWKFYFTDWFYSLAVHFQVFLNWLLITF